jgi:hypothetical protein
MIETPTNQTPSATTTTPRESGGGGGAMAEPGQQLLRSFVEVAAGSHFPIQNLPFGVFRRRGSPPQAPLPPVAIGDFALDLATVADAGLFDGPALSGSPCFHQVPALFLRPLIWFDCSMLVLLLVWRFNLCAVLRGVVIGLLSRDLGCQCG